MAVLRTYAENQAILEPIVLYPASKCKQTKEQGSEDCLWTHIFTFSLSAFFFCQDAIKTRSNCAIISCNLSKKHRLTLYKTQNRETNYVVQTFCKELPVQKLGDRHPNTLELASWSVHVLSDFKTT